MLLVLFFSSCAMMHSGAPAATTVVKASNPEAVASAIVDAFTEHGYVVSSQNADTVTLQRRSSKTDELIYGNWNESTSFERVVVRFSPNGADKFRISCIPYSI